MGMVKPLLPIGRRLFLVILVTGAGLVIQYAFWRSEDREQSIPAVESAREKTEAISSTGNVRVLPLSSSAPVDSRSKIPFVGEIPGAVKHVYTETPYGSLTMRAYFRSDGSVLAMDFSSEGAKPANDTSLLERDYESVEERVIAFGTRDVGSSVSMIIDQLLAYIWPQDIKYICIASVRLRTPVGVPNPDKPRDLEVFLVTVFAKGALPSKSFKDGDAARYVFDADGKLWYTDNVVR